MRKRRRVGPRRFYGALGLVVLASGSAGCNSRDQQIPETPRITTSTSSSAATSAPTSTSSSVASSDESSVVDRYVAFWEARFDANTAPVDPDDPQLREYATGSQLEQVVDETTARRDDGLALRRPADSVSRRRVTVVSNDGRTASVQDCSVNDGIVYRVVTGEVVDDSVATLSIEAELERLDGKWKVASTRLIQQWEGIAGCALAE